MPDEKKPLLTDKSCVLELADGTRGCDLRHGLKDLDLRTVLEHQLCLERLEDIEDGLGTVGAHGEGNTRVDPLYC